ncbi:MAG: DUF4279 domain-containing protein [Caulobacterales bacterium]
MADYTYSVSLRLEHPSRSPCEITTALRLAPSRAWSFGAPRQTRKGSSLTGVYRETYWTARLESGSSADRDLSDTIGAILDRLEDRRAFLREFAQTGGRSELFVGWFFDDGNSGDVLGHDLLGRLADFRLDLSFDVYPASPLGEEYGDSALN